MLADSLSPHPAESLESLAVYSFPLVTITLGLFRPFRGNSTPVRQMKQQNEDENVCALSSCLAASVFAACTAKLPTGIAKALLNDLRRKANRKGRLTRPGTLHVENVCALNSYPA